MARYTRRMFLSTTGALAGSAALAPPAEVRAAVEAGRARTVSVFHTTDLHGNILPTKTYEGLSDVGGLARCASCIRQWRRESPHSLLVDAGDVVQGTPVSLESRGGLVIDLFNELGYDAWVLGNHDFDWGPEPLAANLERSKSPILTANLELAGRTPESLHAAWSRLRPWILKEVGGFRIALVGLITPGLGFWLPEETLGGVRPTDPAESMAKSVAAAKAAGADAIVVVGHMGWKFQDDYANPVRELLGPAKDVDVYLAGHSHQNRPTWQVDDVLCSQASYHGIHCGRVDLTFDLATRKLVDKRAFTLLMDDRFPLDPAVMQAARPDLARSDEELSRQVCRVKQPIAGGGRRNSPLVNMLCEVFAAVLAKRQQTVDGVLHGSFGTERIDAGDLTVADCWKILPYDNLLVTAELSAAELSRVVAEDAKEKKSDRTLWPFTIHFDAGGTPTQVLHRGREAKPDERFRIACNSYDAQSGGRKLMRLREILAKPDAKRSLTSIDTRSALVDGLLDRGEI